MATIGAVLATGEAAVFAASFDLPAISCPQGLLCSAVSATQVEKNPAAYIARLYQIALAVAGIAAVGIIVAGSLFYTFSGGSSDRHNTGKEMITSALWGIALLFGSYIVLHTINPALVLSFGKIGGPATVTTTNPHSQGQCSQYAISGINCADESFVKEDYNEDILECDFAALEEFIRKGHECDQLNKEKGGGGFIFNTTKKTGTAKCHPYYKTYSPAVGDKESVKELYRPSADDTIPSVGLKKGEWALCF